MLKYIASCCLGVPLMDAPSLSILIINGVAAFSQAIDAPLWQCHTLGKGTPKRRQKVHVGLLDVLPSEAELQA